MKSSSNSKLYWKKLRSYRRRKFKTIFGEVIILILAFLKVFDLVTGLYQNRATDCVTFSKPMQSQSYTYAKPLEL